MKTVTGKIISSKPVLISKAASILSNFVSTETGASPAICAYLRRASLAFDELARLHSKSNNKKHKKHKSDAEETPSRAELTHGAVDERKKKEDKTVNMVKEAQTEAETVRKKKKKKEKYGFGNPADDDSKMVIEVKEEQSNPHKKKKKKEGEAEERDNGFGNSAENGGEVVNRRREGGGKVEIKEEDGGKMGIGEEKLDERNKKKRKNRDVEGEMKDGFQEQHSKKKKKRKRDSGGVDN